MIFFVICFFQGLPYWYFVFLRTFGMIAFYWFYFAEKDKHIWKVIWIISIITIQPFFPVEMRRENWLAVDLFWIVLLLIGIIEDLMSRDFSFKLNKK